ncbi:MAG: methyltransferase domain-containing protein [Gammaproteobacteria bacterium]
MPEEAVWAGFFDPPAVLAALGLRDDDTVLDLGSGYGTFALPAAAHTCRNVYALDIEPGLVALLAARAAAAGLDNLHVRHCDVLTSAVADFDVPPATLALAFNILHVEAPVALLRTLRGLLGPDGRLAAIHWRSDIETPRGPPLAIRPRAADIAAWAATAGFGDTCEIDLGAAAPWHYGLVMEC